MKKNIMHLGIFIFVILGLTIGFQGIKKEPVIIVSGKKIYEEEYNFLKRVSTGYMEGKNEKERVTIAKCEQILLKKYKIIEDISYKGFLEELERVNQERKATLKQGGILYGPDTFSPEVYYDYKLSEAREKLYHEILMDEVTDKEVKRYNSETVVEEKQIRYQIALKKYTDILNRMVDDN
ncbi:MAG: hypothetical protein U0I51_07015 [Muricomes sp.]|uniref:hypothetical protein n=1 Tax=Faecalicatena contorta TaxID=39482 RepID=UPI002EC7EE57|nr:hypothetical protein [Muricomes sp.]